MQGYWLELILSFGGLIVIGYLLAKHYFGAEECEDCDGTGMASYGCCPYCGGTGKKHNENN